MASVYLLTPLMQIHFPMRNSMISLAALSGGTSLPGQALLLSPVVPESDTSVVASTSLTASASDVDCAHRGATAESFEPLIKRVPENQEDLLQSLADFCPVVREHRVPSRDGWTSSYEYVPAWLYDERRQSGIELIELVKPAIFITERTGVYRLKQLPNKVIKYYKYCENQFEPLDATINEAFYMALLQDSGIAPRFYYYSGYTDKIYETSDNSKIQSSTCGVHSDSEEPPIRPHIRYIIMDQVGDAVEEYMIHNAPTYRFSFLPAIKLGGQMIELLQKLHTHNIVHGDIHLGNFAFRSPDSQAEIIFLDFGRARVVGPADVANDRRGMSGSCDFTGKTIIFHFLMSKWEMRGCKPTFRDDVYRAVKMIGFAMWGFHYRDAFDELIYKAIHKVPRTRAFYERIMNEADFFTSRAFQLDLGVRIPRGQIIADVSSFLDNISRLAIHENPENPHEKPKYDGILENLKKIINLLEGTSVDDPNIFKLALPPLRKH